MNKKQIIISILIGLIAIGISFTAGYLIAKEDTKQEIKESNTNKTKEPSKNNENKQEEPNLPEEEIKEDDPKEENKDETEISITYTEEKYNTTNKKGIEITKNTRNIPDIKYSSNQKIADKIEKSLIEFSNKEWNSNILPAAKETAEEGPFAESTEPEGLGASLKFSNLPIHNKRITFNLILEGGFGGVGWFNSYGYNYDITTGELLTLKSITNDYSKLMTDLNSEVNRQLNIIKKETEIDDISEEKLKSLITTTGNWYFTEDGLLIIFQKYEIADGATGPITIEINKDFINKHLKDEYKI